MFDAIGYISKDTMGFRVLALELAMREKVKLIKALEEKVRGLAVRLDNLEYEEEMMKALQDSERIPEDDYPEQQYHKTQEAIDYTIDKIMRLCLVVYGVGEAKRINLEALHGKDCRECFPVMLREILSNLVEEVQDL